MVSPSISAVATSAPTLPSMLLQWAARMSRTPAGPTPWCECNVHKRCKIASWARRRLGQQKTSKGCFVVSFWKNLPKNTRILPEFSLCGSTLFGGIEVPNMSHLLEPEVHFNTMFVCFGRYLRQILRLALGAIFAKDHSLQDLKLLASWSSQVWVN